MDSQHGVSVYTDNWERGAGKCKGLASSSWASCSNECLHHISERFQTNCSRGKQYDMGSKWWAFWLAPKHCHGSKKKHSMQWKGEVHSPESSLPKGSFTSLNGKITICTEFFGNAKHQWAWNYVYKMVFIFLWFKYRTCSNDFETYPLAHENLSSSCTEIKPSTIADIPFLHCS